MVIWSRFGFLVGVILVLLVIACEFMVSSLFGQNYTSHHNWPISVAMILAGVACWFLGQKLNGKAPRVMIDKESGQEISMKEAAHSFFFIPVQFWAPILIIGAIAYGIYSAVQNQF